MAAAPPLLLTGNATLNQVDLNPKERDIFDRDLLRIAEMVSLERDLSKMLLDDRDAFLVAAAIAKGSIGTNPQFTGLAANGTEIGMQLIRAITVRNPGIAAGGTPVLTWVQQFAASGWTDLFGSATTPVDLSQTGSAGSSPTNTRGRVVLAFGALLDPLIPKAQEYRVHVGQVDYPVQSLAWMPGTNLFYAKLMGMFIIPVDGRFNMRANINPSPGQDAIELLGLTFSTGIYLFSES